MHGDGAEGAFYYSRNNGNGYYVSSAAGTTSTARYGLCFDAARVVPTSHENRSASISFNAYVQY